ncbi:antirestriction protein ArdA [Nocardia brasiliensis]|uniref:antirestriction protein ArdA n=1 Tax=Nocardia brasiliensis TaxID=37326 RepID=UPI0018940453|nr:antirestriction protein ArdA [Nocardia brasiliensis]MBF6546977.1 antirestriction protein ArdA [Nocardia brasiliensis]
MNERFPNANEHNESQDENESAPPKAEPNRERDPRLNPRIYVTRGLPLRAELTDGAWFDMARDPLTIRAELYSIFADEETYDHEGLYIWDHQDFGGFGVTTGAIGLEGVHSIELLAQVARGVAEHGPAFALWASVHEDDPRLFDHFASAYQGHHQSMAAYVRQLFKPLGIEELLAQAAPEGLQNYVCLDYGGIGEEMLREGDVVAFPADGGGVWIFDERA